MFQLKYEGSKFFYGPNVQNWPRIKNELENFDAPDFWSQSKRDKLGKLWRDVCNFEVRETGPRFRYFNNVRNIPENNLGSNSSNWRTNPNPPEPVEAYRPVRRNSTSRNHISRCKIDYAEHSDSCTQRNWR